MAPGGQERGGDPAGEGDRPARCCGVAVKEKKMAEPAKILLVDDDPDFVEATRLVLQSKSYQIVVAHNGEEGLRKAREEKPDLIILDVIMPLKDGFMTCEELKRNPIYADVPVLMLTSLSEKIPETSYSIQQGMMLEADDFVDKPVSPAELLARVERLLAP